MDPRLVKSYGRSVFGALAGGLLCGGVAALWSPVSQLASTRSNGDSFVGMAAIADGSLIVIGGVLGGLAGWRFGPSLLRFPTGRFAPLASLKQRLAKSRQNRLDKERD
jgi:hypothetical protein